MNTNECQINRVAEYQGDKYLVLNFDEKKTLGLKLPKNIDNKSINWSKLKGGQNLI